MATLTVPFSFSTMEFASSTVFAVTNANRRLLPEYLSNITYDQKEGRKVISFISFLCYLYYSQLKKKKNNILYIERKLPNKSSFSCSAIHISQLGFYNSNFFTLILAQAFKILQPIFSGKSLLGY